MIDYTHKYFYHSQDLNYHKHHHRILHRLKLVIHFPQMVNIGLVNLDKNILQYIDYKHILNKKQHKCLVHLHYQEYKVHYNNFHHHIHFDQWHRLHIYLDLHHHNLQHSKLFHTAVDLVHKKESHNQLKIAIHRRW